MYDLNSSVETLLKKIQMNSGSPLDNNTFRSIESAVLNAEQLNNQINVITQEIPNINRALYTFMLIVPHDVTGALFSALPHPPVASASRWLAPIFQVHKAYIGQDETGFSQAIRDLSKVDNEIAATRQKYDGEIEKWLVYKARFACSVQAARQFNTTLDTIPKECMTQPGPPDVSFSSFKPGVG